MNRMYNIIKLKNKTTQGKIHNSRLNTWFTCNKNKPMVGFCKLLAVKSMKPFLPFKTTNNKQTKGIKRSESVQLT